MEGRRGSPPRIPTRTEDPGPITASGNPGRVIPFPVRRTVTPEPPTPAIAIRKAA
jgi:hypothetical protein